MSDNKKRPPIDWDTDWRNMGQDEYLSGITLYKVTFPEFWEKSYADKNAFFKKIERYAIKFVAETNRGSEFLEGEKIQNFWHEHCLFCWAKASTDTHCTFYCTEDMKGWICEECFEDLQSLFHWTVIDHPPQEEQKGK